MSMSTYVKGYRSPDDAEHQKHLKVLKVCREVGGVLAGRNFGLFRRYQTRVYRPR
jgi:hypothetical protein